MQEMMDRIKKKQKEGKRIVVSRSDKYDPRPDYEEKWKGMQEGCKDDGFKEMWPTFCRPLEEYIKVSKLRRWWTRSYI